MKSTNLMDMMLFVAVVDHKSFTAAADAWNITKSVVSKRISRLEETLGAQLLFRSTRKLSLTEAGQTLYEHCVRIKDELDEARAAISAVHLEPHGILRINCPDSFGYLHLTPAIAEFTKLYPKLKVEVMLGALYEDMIDMGIDLSIRIGDLPDSNLIAKRLALRSMRVCASPNYLKEHGTPKTPEDLKNHNCLIHQNAPAGEDWIFRHHNHDVKVQVSGNFAASSSRTLEAAAVAGMGIVMLPGYMMTSDMKKGNLVSLLEDYCPHNIGIYALYPRTAHLPTKVRTFIDFLHARFDDDAYWR